MKRSLLVEQQGGPLSVVLAGANRHDTKLLEATLEALVVARPVGLEQHLCLDKGYDNPTGHGAVEAFGYVGHIRRIGEEKLDEAQEKTHPARRWVGAADAVMAEQVAGDPRALREEVEELPRGAATGLRTAVVSARVEP